MLQVLEKTKRYLLNDNWFNEPKAIGDFLQIKGLLPYVTGGLDSLVKIEKGEYRPLPTSKKLPAAFSLQDKMPPVYDQFGRGTCVAQAVTALMEYYTDCKWRFSMQYLFEKIKRLERKKLDQAAAEIAQGIPLSDPTMKKEYERAAEEVINALARSGQLSRDGKISHKDLMLLTAQKLQNREVTLSTGSFAYMAMEVLKESGICTYTKWPYSRHTLWLNEEVDAARPEPPPGADEEAARHRLLDRYFPLTGPNNPEHIKNCLVGIDGKRPMPVVIGVLTLNNLELEGDFVRMPKVVESPVKSAIWDLVKVKNDNGEVIEEKWNGFDEKTLQDEPPVPHMDMQMTGGHEMLIVGYQDDESVPGGGYFIVRNSWHTDWGQEGYCKMPYAFVELFVDEACTIEQPMKDYLGDGYGEANIFQEAAAKVPEDLKEYVVTADREQKDRRGKWTIAKGALIIVDKAGVVDLFTEQNALIFRRQGFSWAPPAEATVAGKAGQETQAETGDRISITPELERFFSGLEAAFRKEPLPFPQLGGLRKGWFSSTGKTTGLNLVTDLSARIGDQLHLYNVTGSKASFHIAALYLKSADNAAETAGKLRKILEEYAAQHPFDPSLCTITVIGCNAPIGASVQPFCSEKEVRIVLDNYTAATGWRLSASAISGDAAWCEWLTRLAPNSGTQWKEQLTCAYEDLAATGGHVTLEMVEKATGFNTDFLVAAIAKFAPELQVKGNQVLKK